MRALIARDLADAGIASLSADRRFATACNAALQAANMAIACAGYRIMSKVGHHRVSLESTKLVLGKAAHKHADYSAPLPPQPPRKVALPCSAGSQVVRHSPTSPARACPPCGL